MEIVEQFKNPKNEYRGKPFWSWNGKLEKDELIRQIHVMHKMGFGGYFMHSRTGLETEYLGKEWFELINECAIEGEKLGMESWLYDEDRWPSGTAGGMVTKNPEYRMKFLDLYIIEGKELKWSDDVIAVFVAEVEEYIVHEYSRITKATKKSEYIDKKLLVFSLREMEKSTFYNGYTYVDTLNEEATNEYIRLTHEKYKENCQEHLGKSIRGIFTDEPHRGQLMSDFGSEKTQKVDSVTCVPWTKKLPETFKERFGYDLINKLPELFLIYKGNKVSQVKWHYVELLQQLFIENFAVPINEWCKNNDIILTGHVLHEDSLSNQTAMSGSVMRFYEHMGYPGVDILTEHNKKYWVVKQLSSVARQMGQKWLLSELYGCTGWQFDFENHKNVGDWQALFGINLRCQHLSWYTMKGEAKRDFPASILHQSTWWNEYKYVEDYFSRFNLILSQGDAICDTVVINPVESVWSQIYPEWCKGLDANDKDIIKLEEDYEKLFNWIIGAHIDFDYADEEMMTRHYSIKKDENNSPKLCIGKAEYKQVVVGRMTTIRSSTLNILSEFIEAGGKVIFTKDVPKYVDALKSEKAKELAKCSIEVEFEKDSVVDVVSTLANSIVEVKNEDGTNNETIFVQTRKDKDKRYIVLLNSSYTKKQENVTILFKDNGYLQEWDLRDGKRYIVSEVSGQFELKTDIPAGGEKAFVINNQMDDSLEKKVEYTNIEETININEEFEYELDEKNVCVLDIAKYSIENQKWQEEEEILKIDRKVRKYYDLPYRSGHMLQPWFVTKKGFDEKGEIALAFDFYVDVIPKGDIYLVVEEPNIYEINVNGENVNVKNQDGWWIDICFKKIPLSADVLKKGKNTITMKTKFNEKVELEAIYLIGDFGVSMDGYHKTITSLPKKISIGSITKMGLPFYSGRITYKINCDYIPKDNEKVSISFDEFEAACIKVDDKIVAWKPYEADITKLLSEGKDILVQTVLTRRNTFGPLHQIPLKAPGYGPDNFITKGDNFSMDYMLYEAGILSKPKILVKTKK